MTMNHGQFIQDNFQTIYSEVESTLSTRQRLVESYVDVALDFFKQTLKQIGSWKSPTLTSTAHDYWAAFFCYQLAGVLDTCLKGVAEAIHRLESEGVTITGADETIKAQQKAAKILNWFEQHWDVKRTEQLMHNPPKPLPDSEMIPIEEAISKLG